MNTDTETKPASAKNILFASLLLFLVTFLVFSPAIKNDFVTYDDPEYVTANPYVQQGLTLDGFKWAFAAHGANWHPVTWISHMADGQLYGLRPWGHHLSSVIIHAINASLVFLLFARLTGRRWPAFFIALLFALHPLRVESVAWISERKDVLSTFFFLLTLLAYERYVSAQRAIGSKRRFHYALALIFFGLGLMSKSMLVTTPCVLLLLDYWPLNRFSTLGFSRLLVEKIPFFLLTIAFSLIAFFAQAHGAAMVAAIPLSARTANALVAYCHYLGKIFWPTNLSPLYPFAATLPTATVAEAAALLVIISIFVIALRRTQPALLFGWLWFLGMLVPVIGLVKIGEQSMADRYTYLPSLGITAALVWSVQTFLRKSPRATLALSGLGIVCALACAIVTEHQIKYWHNSETMFQRAVDTTENNTLADVGLGICLAERGQLDAAIALYRHSLIVSPNYFESHYNLGQALSQQGKYDEAIAHFKAAIAQRSGIADTYSSLGVALIGVGRNDDAIAQFQQAARLNPADPLPHDDIAKILSKDDSRLDEAINEFQIALQLQPDNASRHSDLGSLLMRKGRHNEAIAELQEAVKLDPKNADHHNSLGSALGVTGHLDDAITEFQTAIKLNPTDPRAQKNLTRALAMKASAPQNPPLRPNNSPN